MCEPYNPSEIFSPLTEKYLFLALLLSASSMASFGTEGRLSLSFLVLMCCFVTCSEANFLLFVMENKKFICKLVGCKATFQRFGNYNIIF